MNKRNRLIFLSVVSLLFIGSIGCVIHLYTSRPRIAYVRLMELIYKYNGMHDANIDFKNQQQQWQANLDSLKIQYEQAVTDYQNTYKELSEADKKERQERIVMLENNVKKYSAVVNDESEKRNMEISEAVVQQINSFVVEYAKNKGYDMVLGAEGSGAVMYGAKQYDITEEVLSALNKEYKVIPKSTSNAVSAAQ